MTLRNKILLFSAVPVTIVMAIVVGVALWHVRAQMMESARERIATEVSTVANVVDEANKGSVRLAQTLAAVQEEGMFGRREATLRLTTDVLNIYPGYVGSYFAYEPNADGQDAAWLAKVGPNHPSTDAKGRFIPYRFRNLADRGRIELEPQVAMESSLYYNGMKKRFEANPKVRFIITEPYIYNSKNLIIEQTSPIVINGKFEGIAGVDRGLDYLNEYLARLRPSELSNLTLISREGRIIATTLTEEVGYDLRTVGVNDLYLHPDGRLATDLFIERNGKKIVDPQLATAGRLKLLRKDFIEEMQGFVAHAQETEVRHFTGLLTGTELFGASARVPTGDWTIVLTTAAENVNAPIKKTLRWVVLIAFLGVMLVVAILVWLANQVAGRVQAIAGVTQQVADGDMTIDVPVDSDDETGKLQRATRSMVASLNSLIGKVKMASIRLLSTANEIAAGSRQQEAAVNEFSSSTSQITAAAKEISATSQELVGTMNDLKSVADGTATLADAGHSKLSGMASTMGQLMDATGSISSRLATISEKAGNINVVVTTISKVADQTNLLSLNASIEAEKAGEYGLGFAVVAREIRRLADQTAVATLDIESMVKEMQTAVSSGVMEMDKFTDEVRRGAAEVQQVGSQLEEIIQQVQTLTARYGSVTEGMESQSEGARQISDALVGFSEGVEQTARTIKSFHRAAAALQTAVNELRNEIAGFRVKEGDDEAGGERAG